MFSEKDLKQIKLQNLTPEQVKSQLQAFKHGVDFLDIDRAAKINDGILFFTEEKIAHFISLYENAAKEMDVVKFVPASGAASRMFKSLTEYYFEENKNANYVAEFFEQIKEYAFYSELKTALQKDNYEIETLLKSKEYHLILEYILTEKGLNYIFKPKAFVAFHHYEKEIRTAMEEHFVEGAEYAISKNKIVALHFTISEEHEDLFNDLSSILKEKYEEKYSLTFNIKYSFQKSSTNQIAADMNNEAFRNSDGSLLFRPGGHGALIYNLNDIDADIVFVKNIDNIAKNKTIKYNKLLAGVLLDVKNRIGEYLNNLNDGGLNDVDLYEIREFIKNELGNDIPKEIDLMEEIEQYDFYYSFLDRPIRVCGMVKNEGEPGGGPFWVSGSEFPSLQIVEKSQIDIKNKEQLEKIQSATHFNPVDLVCSVKNIRGEKYDLMDFVDDNTDFISIKSKEGKDIKARELPGLWNGAMADWITLFVEVPIETFNPVKTVEDLLRDAHQ
jgi:Domain of unknown function (DUF4301)